MITRLLCNLLYRYLRMPILWTSIVLLRARAWGVNHVPRRGGLILASNHQSFADPPLVGMVMPRVLFYMARDSLFRNPFFGGLIHAVNALPVRRGTGDLAAFRQSLRVLQAGHALLLFPEGTRSPDGHVGHMEPGVIALARKAGVPIIPVAIEGAFEMWPRQAILPRMSPVRVEIGPPIRPADLAGLDSAAAADALTRRLRDLHNVLRKRMNRAPLEYPRDDAPEHRSRRRLKVDRTSPQVSEPTSPSPPQLEVVEPEPGTRKDV